MGRLDDLERLQKLKESGTLTQEEFEKEKYKILNNIGNEDKNKENIVKDKDCNKYDNELSKEDKFSDNSNPPTNKSVKSNKKILIYIAIFIVVLIIIGGIAIIKNNSKNVSNNETIKEQESQQVQNKSIDIKLYDVNNDKPSIIKLDNTIQSGAVYDFTIEDFKTAVQKICEKNNISDFKVSENTDEIYSITIEVNKVSSIIMNLSIENNKIVGLGYGSYSIKNLIGEEATNYDEICNNIIIELLGKEYANELIKSNKELSSNEYRYTNYTMIMKFDIDTFNSLTEQDMNLKENINMDITAFSPITEEKYNDTNTLLTSMKSQLQEKGIAIIENSNGTKFKDINSISYIKFISDTKFEMMLGVEGSEVSTKTGTYNKNGDIVTLNVSYDSELEPNQYNGITEPFSPYEIQINIKDENTLQYIDKYNTTYTFKKGIIDDEKDYSIKSEEKTDKNTTSNSSSSNKLQTSEPKKEWTYTHVALEGCVITSSNSKTGEVTYRKKCESCGTVQPGINSTYMRHGILDSSFYCAKCKKIQKIRIEATSEYK